MHDSGGSMRWVYELILGGRGRAYELTDFGELINCDMGRVYKLMQYVVTWGRRTS